MDQDHLPPVLRRSGLPWTPLREDQAAAPGPNDGWRAWVGSFRLRLLTELREPRRTPATYSLELVEPLERREVGRWDGLTLEAAARVARAVTDVLLWADVIERSNAG
jgi:hypothetical protein